MTKLKATPLVIPPVAFISRGAEEDQAIIHPDQIFRCLKEPAAPGLTVITHIDPYYLRGDFDGDGKPDYAVAVRGVRTKRNGILVCAGNDHLYVLGADQPINPPFSDLPGDNFVSRNWAVDSPAETRELAAWTVNVPRSLPKVWGDTIGMIWEDGISLIYWDGSQFRWAGSKTH
jgi:hypothetical protein